MTTRELERLTLAYALLEAMDDGDTVRARVLHSALLDLLVDTGRLPTRDAAPMAVRLDAMAPDIRMH